MSYTAQELNTKITLSRYTYEVDEIGQPIVTYVPYAEAFAKFEPLIGREFFASAQTTSEAQAKVTMRWRRDLDATDRLTARGQHWDIVSIQNIKNRNRELLIYVKRNPIADG
ncbi:phage head closure protein [Pseudoxanthomonas taiwanensis]|uniref:Head-tail adaptor protein n=1 Tax=Pseudoxanthomonas taiwanensis TaxID=176598 RepID=A0A921NW45_9GAMM|nr:phage head closure protein [Pseudoxanthomonas taiwanensis]KAF1684880.1 hypothetical protein CR938_13385 [Pseudoxanthomonas taiwanensis]